MKSLRPPAESSLPAAVTHLAVGPEGQIVTQTAVGERASLKVRWHGRAASPRPQVPLIRHLPPPSALSRRTNSRCTSTR